VPCGTCPRRLTMFTMSQRATPVCCIQIHRSSIPPPLQMWVVGSISGLLLLLPCSTRVCPLASHTVACSEPQTQLATAAWPAMSTATHQKQQDIAIRSSHSSFNLTSLAHAGRMTTRDIRSTLGLTSFGLSLDSLNRDTGLCPPLGEPSRDVRGTA